jgi:flagellar biogenesis protein FliO
MHIDYFRVVLSLALCLGLGVGAIYLLRSRFRGLSSRVARDLSLLESLQIDPRTAVHVLGYKGERLLLTTRDNAIHVTALRGADADATSEPAPQDDAADTNTGTDATAANAAEPHAGARAS